MESEKVKEIKKALECCANWNGQSSCNDCPIGIEKCYEDENLMPKLALTLINELESENDCKDIEISKQEYQIEKLKDRIAELEKENADYKDTNNILRTRIDKSKEISNRNGELLLKQFAERLKEKGIRPCDLYDCVTVDDIDETLKEFMKE
jgi:hypothetical protein